MDKLCYYRLKKKIIMQVYRKRYNTSKCFICCGFHSHSILYPWRPTKCIMKHSFFSKVWLAYSCALLAWLHKCCRWAVCVLPLLLLPWVMLLVMLALDSPRRLEHSGVATGSFRSERVRREGERESADQWKQHSSPDVKEKMCKTQEVERSCKNIK